MTYVNGGEIVQDRDYLILGYKNRFGQYDVAKFHFSLLTSYYITSADIDLLSAKIDQLSAFLSSCLDRLSSENDGDRITIPELSTYCSYGRFSDMLDQRTFVGTEQFMDYLKENLTLSSTVYDQTRLQDVGLPLGDACQKIEDIFFEARQLKKEDEKKG